MLMRLHPPHSTSLICPCLPALGPHHQKLASVTNRRLTLSSRPPRTIRDGLENRWRGDGEGKRKKRKPLLTGQSK
ncbi:hypothetical protein AAFF_G00419440 [Aldrovandia affinis]|uniref:Uncharacterized protein n=1 Tax=Aldrovandia affinis TaxID=143900 RepID=A0AAD7S9Z3_9TELE|nr:hypothetical protein AAFF_G00419440 [Aldrovandia affinis]